MTEGHGWLSKEIMQGVKETDHRSEWTGSLRRKTITSMTVVMLVAELAAMFTGANSLTMVLGGAIWAIQALNSALCRDRLRALAMSVIAITFICFGVNVGGVAASPGNVVGCTLCLLLLILTVKLMYDGRTS
jgi:hypothetical protein